MTEGPKKILPSIEKPKSFFPERGGEFTQREKSLSKSLSAYVKNSRISSSSFISKGLFGEQNILDDQEKVAGIKNSFENRRKELALSKPDALWDEERGHLSEQAMIYGMQTGEWFGESKVRVASEYDDLCNGVDCIVEFDSTKQLAVGIDTTMSPRSVEGKLLNIRGKILVGALGEVRYFENENFTGSLHNVPLTVIGVSREANSSLAELVYNAEIIADSITPIDKPDKKYEAKRELKFTTIQFIVLFEIRTQLEYFLEFAVKNGQDRIAIKLRQDLEQIKRILVSKAPKDKLSQDKLIAEIKKDSVYQEIKRVLEQEFKNYKPNQGPKILVAKIK